MAGYGIAAERNSQRHLSDTTSIGPVMQNSKRDRKYMVASATERLGRLQIALSAP